MSYMKELSQDMEELDIYDEEERKIYMNNLAELIKDRRITVPKAFKEVEKTTLKKLNVNETEGRK